MKIASWLIAHNLLTVDQANAVLAAQKKQAGHVKERFGRIAVNMGYLTEAQLNSAYLAKERDETGF